MLSVSATDFGDGYPEELGKDVRGAVTVDSVASGRRPVISWRRRQSEERQSLRAVWLCVTAALFLLPGAAWPDIMSLRGRIRRAIHESFRDEGRRNGWGLFCSTRAENKSPKQFSSLSMSPIPGGASDCAVAECHAMRD